MDQILLRSRQTGVPSGSVIDLLKENKLILEGDNVVVRLVRGLSHEFSLLTAGDNGTEPFTTNFSIKRGKERK